MLDIIYDRERAVAYAKRWALSRNPTYLDFSALGGDCANFVSQCIFQGIGVMNYTPDYGWYYIDGNRKSPSWTAARYLHRFLLTNDSVGPYAQEVPREEILPGDVIQLANEWGVFYHTLLATHITGDEIYIAAHTNDAYMRPLSSYEAHAVSFLKILGGRQYGDAG